MGAFGAAGAFLGVELFEGVYFLAAGFDEDFAAELDEDFAAAELDEAFAADELDEAFAADELDEADEPLEAPA